MDMSFFGDLERFMAELYPYRWPITIGALIVFAAGIAFAYRLGWHQVVWRYRLPVAIVATPVLVLTIFAGYYTVSPLFERTNLEEPSPLVAASGSSETSTGGATPDDGDSEFAGRIIASGEFEGTDDFHFGRGQALLIETAPDTFTLRFENFSVRNGPDLFIYLSPDPDDYTDDSLELGELKATDGAFNYEVPAGTDVSEYKSAVVWCKPFGVLFAVATLDLE